MSFLSSWYLIYTKPRHEKKVSRQLLEKDISHFLPVTKTLRQWHDRKKLIEAPLFPGYIFVNLKGTKDFLRCEELAGVYCFVKYGKERTRVPDHVIDQIRLLVLNAKSIDVTTDKLQPGQKLIIEQGALAGLFCEVVKRNGRDTILVRIDFLNRNLLIDMPINYLTLKTA